MVTLYKELIRTNGIFVFAPKKVLERLTFLWLVTAHVLHRTANSNPFFLPRGSARQLRGAVCCRPSLLLPRHTWCWFRLKFILAGSSAEFSSNYSVATADLALCRMLENIKKKSIDLLGIILPENYNL